MPKKRPTAEQIIGMLRKRRWSWRRAGRWGRLAVASAYRRPALPLAN